MQKQIEQKLNLEEYFTNAFLKMYEENQNDDIKPEQYANNIDVMLKIALNFFI